MGMYLRHALERDDARIFSEWGGPPTTRKRGGPPHYPERGGAPPLPAGLIFSPSVDKIRSFGCAHLLSAIWILTILG